MSVYRIDQKSVIKANILLHRIKQNPWNISGLCGKENYIEMLRRVSARDHDYIYQNKIMPMAVISYIENYFYSGNEKVTSIS